MNAFVRPLRPDELMHYGVKGMHWGIRRYQPYPSGAVNGKFIGDEKRARHDERMDEKLRKFMKRRVSADERNMKIKAKAERDARANYNSLNKDYRKELGKSTLFKKKKAERLNTVYDDLHKAENQLGERRRETLQAENLYKRDANYYAKHIKSMQAKYGSEKIKTPKTKVLKEKGRMFFEKDPYIRNVLDVGLTVADVPFIGTKFTASYVSKEDRASIDERIKKRNEIGFN